MLILHHMHEYQTLFNNIKYNSFPFLFLVCAHTHTGLHYTHIENGIFHSRSRYVSLSLSCPIFPLIFHVSLSSSYSFRIFLPNIIMYISLFSLIFFCLFIRFSPCILFFACFLRIYFVMIDGRYQNQVKYEVYILQFRMGRERERECMVKKRETFY